MARDVVVVGSINADLVVQVERHPLPGETLLGRTSVVLPGGKGANQAVAAARLGADVAMVGAVGEDVNATTALSGLRDAGVDLAHVHTVDAPTGLAVVTLSDDGENTIVVVPGANAAVGERVVDGAADLVTGARVCVVQAEIPLATVAHVARLADAGGTRLVLNVAPAAELPLETVVAADPLVVNEHEAATLLGRRFADAGDAARELAARGVRSVVVTLGAGGVVGVEDGATWSLPARTVDALDTTGAGDAFVGALAAGIADGLAVEQAAVLATRVAAASVTRLGAQPSYPWRGDDLP
ncbi:ribokinase [Cellulomonas sp. ACRRI]|uniref:ribokinase n=1 Tax=Cellulomonas sp. ACRRI TaxID=2918188 RepID=UPI001EF2CA83|nr:ribokinase [Cellulomonas sp. ACRRI]MCG7286511.1 ribokinase [Cellulomonas sp. ACRRI]